MSSFLGRGEELRQVARLLEERRLVTLTGPPGIGKSRIALEVASSRPDDGAALVELAPIGDPELVPHAVAAALSVQEVPGHTLIEALVAHLRRNSLLLVLDNCEHLVAACAEVVDELLCACPGLRVLATSREALSITGELVWQVPPLAVPAPDAEPRPDALMGYDGVRLFVERARAVAPQFVLSGEVAPAVAEIVRRLDGIPLAIELAAARAEMLTPPEIAERLDDRFALLTKGSRSDLARHQTLQAALDWSHELLSAPERALLRRLSVFVGGFCLEAARAVCACADLGDADVFDLLAQLVAKSVVVADSTTGVRGRYRLLETLRSYAGDRLEEAGESAPLREAHACFYLALAERAEPELTGAEQAHWFERLETDHENLRGALRWLLGHDRSVPAVRLAGALVLFWRVRCYFSEGRELLEAAVQASEGEGEGASALRAKALWGLGFMAMMAGDPDGALRPLEESLSRFRELDDRSGCARALLILGNRRSGCADPGILEVFDESATLAREAGDTWCLAHALAVAGLEHASINRLPAARALLEESIAVARQARDKQGLRLGLLGLGKVAVRQGDYRVAEPILEEAEAVTKELGEELGRAWAILDLGHLALGQGDYVRARELGDRARALFPELTPRGIVIDLSMLRAGVALAEGDYDGARSHLDEVHRCCQGGGIVGALPLLGELALGEGNQSEAQRAFENARDVARRFGDEAAAAQALHGLGRLARASGNTKRAAALHSEALGLRHDIGDARGIAASLDALAGLAATSGRPAHGARLLGAAQALRDANGYAPTFRASSCEHDDVALIRQSLSAQEFEAALTQGSGLTTDEAITQACKARGPRGRPASGWSSLTNAERQVAELVAEGLTNREIAERLFVTPGTVKNHASHIFSKLGIRGRVALAREVRAAGTVHQA